MKAKDFCDLLKQQGFNFFTGVPCTILKDIINFLTRDNSIIYVPATREEEAIGIATGAYLGGKKPVVLMQNTGFSNSIGAITSLVLLYKIPMLFVISWRGYKGKDAPEHRIIGRCVLKLLEDIDVPAQILTEENCEKAVLTAVEVISKQQTPSAIMIRAGIINEQK